MRQADSIVSGWPLRSWSLAISGALIGLAIHQIITVNPTATINNPYPSRITEDHFRLAAATFLGVSWLVTGFVIERAKPGWTAIFAGLSAFVTAAAIYWNGSFGFSGASEPWRVACAALTVVIAAPLFQAWRDSRLALAESRWHIPYVAAHNRAWTNVVLWCASWAFVGIAWALAYLLSELFDLIGLHFLHDLLMKDGVGKALTGAALGAAIGLLRDREQILGLLQRVVTAVLSVLTPVLAIGLLTFLIALPFTGLSPLWQATKSTTPILIGCVIGALSLLNAVIGNSPEEESRFAVLRWSVMVLCVVMLPLGVIAAISTSLRIHQYGLTPERLWAATFSAIACAYGVAYIVSLRSGSWIVLLRRTNLRFAIGLCGLAFILSTPLVSFGALATRDQLARLTSGKTPADKFDWKALRFKFGPKGLAAVRDLVKTGATPEIRSAAAAAARAQNPWEAETASSVAMIDKRLTILPETVVLPQALRDQLGEYSACGTENPCTVIYHAGATEAFVIHDLNVVVWHQDGKTWSMGDSNESAGFDALQISPVDEPARKARKARIAAALARHEVELRPVTRRQIFIGGEPVGEPFK